MNWLLEHKATLKRLIVEADDAIGTTDALPYTMPLLEIIQTIERMELIHRAEERRCLSTQHVD